MSLEDQLKFKEEFTKIALNTKGVKEVIFFGSFATPKWTPGKSDIDIYIRGDVSPEDKKRLRQEVIRLNAKYRLQLETACFLHHTPIFSDDKVIGPAVEAYLRGETVDKLFRLYRRSMKRICIPHKVAWKLL